MRNYIMLVIILALVISCGSDSSLTDEQIEKYTSQGNKIAQASFKKLSNQLQAAIKAGGVENAVGFCNVAALPLTDSLSTKYNAIIKRTSLKLRNSKNGPDSLEKKMLDMYLIMSRMRNPIMIPKILEKNKDKIQFYAPIMIANETCLKCHGIIEQTMLKDDYDIIKRFYPNDKAIDYKLGQFRGMWSITLKQ
ncbi:MAG: DUF3365 domain-containing protein [Cyclobacteriaceae bacterium]|nr:DUF3365 domain-containing protein [Cyclobacteriaceae bacterium]